MVHVANFDIRTFHTDAFGHVNNARYLEFFEEARWQFAESIGLVELLIDSNFGFIIMDLKLRFRSPVCEGDSISISTQLISLGSASGEVVQKVTRGDTTNVVTRFLAHFILIDRSNGKSVPIDGAIGELLDDVIEPETRSRKTTVIQ